MKANGRHQEFREITAHVEPRAAQLPPSRRWGHLPSRIHLHRGFRLRGRLVRFAKHRRKSTAG